MGCSSDKGVEVPISIRRDSLLIANFEVHIKSVNNSRFYVFQEILSHFNVGITLPLIIRRLLADLNSC
jgi:hypothetical protein